MRKGDWIKTFSGNQFWPMDPRVEEIRIDDIAHSLSLQCRYAGHVRRFYSVAQHCVMAAQIVPVQDALWGLLHDASEAYLVDLPTPIKKHSRLGEEYQKIEKKLMGFVAQRFHMMPVQPESVSRADRILLMTEMRDLMGHTIEDDNGHAPLPFAIDPWTPAESEHAFLSMAECLIQREYL